MKTKNLWASIAKTIFALATVFMLSFSFVACSEKDTEDIFLSLINSFVDSTGQKHRYVGKKLTIKDSYQEIEIKYDNDYQVLIKVHTDLLNKENIDLSTKGAWELTIKKGGNTLLEGRGGEIPKSNSKYFGTGSTLSVKLNENKNYSINFEINYESKTYKGHFYGVFTREDEIDDKTLNTLIIPNSNNYNKLKEKKLTLNSEDTKFSFKYDNEYSVEIKVNNGLINGQNIKLNEKGDWSVSIYKGDKAVLGGFGKGRISKRGFIIQPILLEDNSVLTIKRIEGTNQYELRLIAKKEDKEYKVLFEGEFKKEEIEMKEEIEEEKKP